MQKHVLQSKLWMNVKKNYGTPALFAGGVVYTKHTIPFTNTFYAYAPRVDPKDVNFEDLKKSLEENNCIALQFDVPNVVEGSPEEEEALSILNSHCVKSSRDEFAKATFTIDLTKSEDDLLAGMHKKHRYNIKLAQKNGVIVREAKDDADFDIFFELYKETGTRQKFYYRQKRYLKEIWDVFKKENAVHILIAEHEGKPLAAWLFLVYEDTLYYPYGGSTTEDRNLFASNLLGWEAIKLGKKLECKIFDMWGASYDLDDTCDEYYGFSQFKKKYGAKHVKFIDSYDFVINSAKYKLFITANSIRWKVLKVLR